MQLSPSTTLPLLLDLFPLSKAPDYLPRTSSGNRQHPAKLHHWRKRGVRGVHLRCQRIGGNWFTSEAWIQDFVARLSSDESSPTAPSPAQIVRQHRAAELELSAAGI